jgi:F420-dependent methylenetetrahydromethanopterin dehydrogenase
MASMISWEMSSWKDDFLKSYRKIGFVKSINNEIKKIIEKEKKRKEEKR